ncbi:MAG: hypothetical protein HYY30_06590 [Chloroflexi bacterium]|nr:hypothetical protein [Chloroflexota bacterium]
MKQIHELFCWSDWIEHISLHSITPEEVYEAVFEDRGGVVLRVGPDERIPDETSYRYFERTEAGRHLMVVLLYLGQGIAMPVTAREMTPRERRRFDERHFKSR